jgi:maltose alpha-D-glucosyltransferase / alpha-amylase
MDASAAIALGSHFIAFEYVRDSLEIALPGYLKRQRWFADKQREIVSVNLTELAVVVQGDPTIALAIVDVHFRDNGASGYFVPLTLSTSGTQPESRICKVSHHSNEVEIGDAVPSPDFHAWLLESLRSDQDFSGVNGHFTFLNEGTLDIPHWGIASRLAGAEQSNSSILYGESLIAKVYRRLSAGTNPDVEIGRFLTHQGSFGGTPKLAGSANYEDEEGAYTIAMMQELLPNPEECWSHVLRLLTRDDWQQADIGAPLGRATAEMHLALASGGDDPDFAPVDATPAEIDAWKESLVSQVELVSAALVARLDQFDANTRELAESFLAISPQFRNLAYGFELLVGLPTIRVHGDYHLGQVLLLPDGRLSIVDFEGEPQRPIHERRKKTSPLKDVAGMMRSFSYARGAARPESDYHLQASLSQWERSQRHDFLREYILTIEHGKPQLLPLRPDELERALAAWEADKALYEVMYELASRPEWLWLPLSAVVSLA